MGYTHYFSQQENIPQNSWDKICKDVKIILDHQQKEGVLLESNHPSEIMINKKAGYINFNGVGDDSHETFSITQEKHDNFNFCKTNQKPYDLALVASLMVIEHHAPESFNIGSDGNIEDWQDAAKLNQNILGHAFHFPKDIAQRNPELAEEIEKNLTELNNKNLTQSPKNKSRYNI